MAQILTVTLNPALDISASVNRIVIGPKLRCEGGRLDPGGGGVNVSRAIRILGGHSETFVATAGTLGDLLVEELRFEGIDPIRFETTGQTRQSISVFEEETREQLRLVLPGPVWNEGRSDEVRQEILKHIDEDWIVVASGGLPRGLPSDFYVTLNSSVIEAGAKMILDTSGKALMSSVKQVDKPYYVLRMDRLEAEGLAGRDFLSPSDMAKFAKQLVDEKIAEIVILARGAEGSIFASESGSFIIHPPKVVPLSKVGAGDSFVGALTKALANGENLRNAGIYATAAAASAVQTDATNLCEKNVTEKFTGECVVYEL